MSLLLEVKVFISHFFYVQQKLFSPGFMQIFPMPTALLMRKCCLNILLSKQTVQKHFEKKHPNTALSLLTTTKEKPRNNAGFYFLLCKVLWKLWACLLKFVVSLIELLWNTTHVLILKFSNRLAMPKTYTRLITDNFKSD